MTSAGFAESLARSGVKSTSSRERTGMLTSRRYFEPDPGYGSVIMNVVGRALDPEHERVLLAATRRGTVAHALGWIAEGHALDDAVPLHAVVEAVLAAERVGANAGDAVVAISQRATRSTLDPATMLFDEEAMPGAQRLRHALDVLASKCTAGR